MLFVVRYLPAVVVQHAPEIASIRLTALPSDVQAELSNIPALKVNQEVIEKH